MRAVPGHQLEHQRGTTKQKFTLLLTAAAVDQFGLMDMVLRDIMNLLARNCHWCEKTWIWNWTRWPETGVVLLSCQGGVVHPVTGNLYYSDHPLRQAVPKISGNQKAQVGRELPRPSGRVQCLCFPHSQRARGMKSTFFSFRDVGCQLPQALKTQGCLWPRAPRLTRPWALFQFAERGRTAGHASPAHGRGVLSRAVPVPCSPSSPPKDTYPLPALCRLPSFAPGSLPKNCARWEGPGSPSRPKCHCSGTPRVGRVLLLLKQALLSLHLADVKFRWFRSGCHVRDSNNFLPSKLSASSAAPGMFALLPHSTARQSHSPPFLCSSAAFAEADPERNRPEN